MTGLELILELAEGSTTPNTLQHIAKIARKAIVALEKQPAMQEPVVNASAWFALVMNAAAELEDASHCLRDEDAKRMAISGAKHYRDAAKALYTTPPAQEPLTDEEIIDHFKASVDTGLLLSFVDGVRYAEAAHGIKEEA